MYKARAQEEFLDDTIEVGIWKDRLDGRREFAKLALSEFRVVEQGEVVPADCRMKMPADEMRAILQALMDMCWDHGIRPARQCGEKGEIARLEDHLEDMRKIVEIARSPIMRMPE